MITLDRPLGWYKVALNPDSYGQQSEVWTLNKVVWAKLVPQRGYEAYEANQKVFVGNTRFVVRWDEGWETIDRLIDGDIVYDIISIQEYQSAKKDTVNTREQYLLLDCQDRDSEDTGRDG